MRTVRIAFFAGTVIGLAATLACAGTITEPASNPFTVPGDPAGNPLSFDVSVAGFKAGGLVYVEQCDGTPPTTQGWSPTVNCDLGTSPAAAVVAGDGTATFAANDPNHAFVPFKGPSPQGLFNCLATNDPSPNNGLPDFHDCQLRASTNNTVLTPDQAFVSLDLPNGPGGPPTTSTTSTSTTSTTTIPPCSTQDLKGAACALKALDASRFCTSDGITDALVKLITVKLAKADAALQRADKQQEAGRPNAAIRLELLAVGKMDQIFPHVARDRKHRRISAACQRSINDNITPVHDRLLQLAGQQS